MLMHKTVHPPSKEVVASNIKWAEFETCRSGSFTTCISGQVPLEPSSTSSCPWAQLQLKNLPPFDQKRDSKLLSAFRSWGNCTESGISLETPWLHAIWKTINLQGCTKHAEAQSRLELLNLPFSPFTSKIISQPWRLCLLSQDTGRYFEMTNTTAKSIPPFKALGWIAVPARNIRALFH